MLEDPVVKHRPADFLVRENMVVATAERANASQHYLMLRKCGYTTMEAVRILASFSGLPTADVTYGGLKDEDAITEQLVAVPVGTLPDPVDGAWSPTAGAAERWIRLYHHGYGQEPFEIGRLEGNGFRVVIRNLTAEIAQRLAELRKLNLFFLNYYDVQRFGVPGGPKLTHLVGGHMLAGNWDAARDTLIALRAPESAAARAWEGSSKGFFDSLDRRISYFYLAAYGSEAWNAGLRKLVRTTDGGGHIPVETEGVRFDYVGSNAQAFEVLSKAPELPYSRYTFDGACQEGATSMRPTVIQTYMSISTATDDEFFPGRFSIELSFFLPSGCYATAALRQLLARVRTAGPPLAMASDRFGSPPLSAS